MGLTTSGTWNAGTRAAFAPGPLGRAARMVRHPNRAGAGLLGLGAGSSLRLVDRSARRYPDDARSSKQAVQFPGLPPRRGRFASRVELAIRHWSDRRV